MSSLFILMTLIFALSLPATLGEAKEKHHKKGFKCEENVTLTEEQKQKLDGLVDELYEKKKEIFETAGEYGVISEEQKDKHIELMNKKKMKKAKNKWCQDKTE